MPHYRMKIFNGKREYIHRIKWIENYGLIPEGYVIHHIDGNKSNNDISNLQMIKRGENTRRASEDGLIDNRGEKNGQAKLSKGDVEKMLDYRKQGLSQYEIARLFNVDQGHVSKIINKRRWSHVRTLL